MDEPSQGSASGPVDHSWSRAFCYRVTVLYKLLGCYLNVNVSTPVFMSYSIINVQLAHSFKRKFYSHANPLRNKFSAAIIRCQKLLSTEGVNLKNIEIALETFLNGNIGLTL